VAYMRFRGEVGQQLYERVAHCLDWLQGASRIRELRGRDYRRAEEELVAFLLNARFGETAILEKGYASQLDYIRQSHALNPDCFRLLLGREPLSVDLETRKGVVTLGLGYAEGLSMAVPMTRKGYEDYIFSRIWSLEIGREHVVPRDEIPADPCYVYLGTLFHFPAMPRLLKAHRGQIESVGMPDNSVRLMRQLFRHASGFLPRIHYDEGQWRYVAAGGRPDNLPTLFCATDGEFGDGLVYRAGFECIGINKLGLPLCQLRFGDVNDAETDAERWGRIRETIRLYQALTQHT